MTDPLDAIAEIVDVPAGSAITEAIVIVGYLDPEGELSMGFVCLGDSTMTTYVGMTAWVQTSIILDHDKDQP